MRSGVAWLLAGLAGACLWCAAAAAVARPLAPPEPLSAARYLAAQRAGFGDSQQAAALAARAAAQAARLRARPLAAARVTALSGAWHPLGPAPVTDSFYGGAVSGRVDSVAVVPSGPQAGELFVGTAGGGVWSSTDGGHHWVTHTDQVTTGLAIGALAIDPANPQVIYAGTGEDNMCGDCLYGGGVLKSSDGGNSWTVENPQGVFSGVDFAALAVDPGNDSHLYAATSQGLYESSDGGQTWSHPAGAGDFTDPATAVVLDPSTTPATAFVATAGLGIQQSTDGGANFITLGGGLPAAANFAGASVSLGTASSGHPSGDRTMYAGVALTGVSDPSGGQLSLYKSTDAGATWTRLSIPAYTNQSYAFGSGGADQATYDNTLLVDPNDPAHVLAGGISLVETTDGGTNWTDVNGQDFFGNGLNVLHPDFHAAAYSPGGAAILGSDGGVFAYDPAHRGPAGVTDLNTDLGTGQAYEVAADAAGTTILSGLQDNGTALYRGGSAWPAVVSGNGGYSAINPFDHNQQVAESSGHLILTATGWSGPGSDITPPGEPDGATNFVPPVLLAPSLGSPDAPTLYYGGGDLWATSDPAAASPTWTQLTNVGTGVSAIAAAPSNPAVLYVGFDDGTLAVSTNATSPTPSFTTIPSGVGEWITHIAVDPSDPRQIALSFSSSNTHAYAVPPMVETASVALSGAPSASLTDVTGDLPSGVASNSVLFDGGSLVVATDVGVFATSYAALDGASTVWTAVGSALPNVQVIGLTQDAAGNLYAATHGRGVWELPAPALPPAPSLLAPPQITGTAVQGQTLTALAAAWSGSPSSVIRRWLRCIATACSAIPNASGTTYVLGRDDIGFSIEVQETAVGAGGTSLPATSAATGVVAAAPSPPPSPPPPPKPPAKPPAGGGKPSGPPRTSITQALAGMFKASAQTAATVLRRGYWLRFTAPGAGHLSLVWTARSGRARVTLGSLQISFSRARQVRLVLRLNARGRKLLARAHRLTVYARSSFAAHGTGSVTVNHRFVIGPRGAG